MVAGLGPRASFGEETFRAVLARVLDALAGLSVKRAVMELPGRGDGVLDPERAADILLDVVGDDADREALCLVEEGEAQRRIEKHAAERHRTALRAQGMR